MTLKEKLIGYERRSQHITIPSSYENENLNTRPNLPLNHITNGNGMYNYQVL
jgi:hypothetical protein